jgi:hypothetical protein
MIECLDLRSDKEFKTVLYFISKKWKSRFNKSSSISMTDRRIEIHSFKKALKITGAYTKLNSRCTL